MTHQLTSVWLDDRPDGWAAAGFDVRDDSVAIGNTVIRLGSSDDPQRGIQAVSIEGLDGPIDGIDLRPDESEALRPAAADSAAHPNGVVHIDHLVVFSPDVERTRAALATAGLEVRRTRVGDDGRRQVFFWLGDVILELIGPVEPDTGPPIVWGLALSCADIDAAADLLGPALGSVKPAIQEGRRIATIRTKDLGISTAIALMTPHGG